MHVIGTAGHVDHGKTTLIKALTGINPDRLPEEKKRGMTIDLGFAWFSGNDGEQVGVIDVPGHERFIRNMVAGAWSLDCVLLLVAADDGWMRQTQDHAVVIASLGVRAVILVVTKTDTVAPERVHEIRADALAKCTAIFGCELPMIDVSAVAGRNIDELRDLIISTLSAVPARPTAFPYMYVDRVFSIKGSGLVVTGSLSGAAIAKGDALELLPQHEVIRIRGMQTYNAAIDRALPVSRVALNLQKPRAEVSRGNLITMPGAPFRCEKELIARVRPIAADDSAIRNHSEIEVALGTGNVIAQIHFLENSRFARISMQKPLPALWNQSFVLIRHGGSAIVGSGSILWFGEVPRRERRRFTGLLADLSDPASEADHFFLELGFHGLARRPTTARGMGGEAAVSETAELGDAATVVLGEWVFHGPWLQRLSSDIVSRAGQAAGISALELQGQLHVDGDALRAVLESLISKGSLSMRNSLYFAGQGERLPQATKKLLDRIVAGGETGFEGIEPELNTLVRLGRVVPLEGGIFYAREIYNRISGEILAGKKRGDKFSIPEAKERTGLSRKYMLPLLNRMEKDGLLKREGNVRIVL